MKTKASSICVATDPAPVFTTRLTVAAKFLAAVLFLAGIALPAQGQTYALTNVWYVPATAVSANNLITTGDQNRSLAYDAVSNQVFVAAKAGGSPAPGIEVLDAATGGFLGLLDKTVVSGGTFALNQVKVAADGAIYTANLQTPAVGPGTPTKIYRWTNWQSVATVAFAGNSLSNPATFFTITSASGQRVGDSMDVTGSGVNTMIVMPVSTSSPTISTNFIIFTTADGVNFTNHILAVSGFTAAGSPICGVSFYTNNTFLVRTSGGTGNNVFLIQFPANIASLDAGPVAGTQIGSYALPNIVSTTAFINYKSAVQGGFLAVASMQNSGGASAVGQVALYSDPVVGNTGCSLQLATTNYPHPTTDGNLAGAVALGGLGYAQYIFSLDCNNGVRCSAITAIPAQPPSIAVQPAGNTVFPPYTLSVTAAGYCPLVYQWQATNNAGGFTNIPGANSGSYTIASPSTNYYRVVITNTINPAVTSSVVLVTAQTPVTNSAVSPLWRVAAGTAGYGYLPTAGDATRGLAYDANTHRVIVASTAALNILNGDNGTNVGTLILPSGGFGGALGGCDQVGIADDGAVYACNLATTGVGFNLFRWGGPTNNAPVLTAFTGDPGSGSGDRWGDTIAVRGSGLNTQIILGSRSGTNVALLTTVDGTNFTASLIGMTNVSGGFAGYGISFGAGNTIWGKVNLGALTEVSFDPVGLTGGGLLSYASPSQIPTYLVGAAEDPVNNLFAGVDLGDIAHDLKFYQLTGTADAPVLFHQAFFASANANGNANAVVVMKYPRCYALDVNNGLVAVTYGVPPTSPPTVNSPPASQTTYTNNPAVTFGAGVSGSLPLYYQWQFSATTNEAGFSNLAGATNSAYTLAYPALNQAGYYRVIAHNISGYATSAPPALLTLLVPTTSVAVTQLWTLPAGSLSFLDNSSYNTRGLAYDTNSGTVLLADHNNIHLLAATNGSYLGDLNVLGVANVGYNGWLFDQIGVADDGTLYAANLAGVSGSGLYSIVTWAPGWTVGTGATGYAYGGGSGGDPGNGSGERWGDTLAVRGAGLNTEILIGGYNSTNVVLFTTTDGTSFTPNLIAVTNVPGGFSGQGIAFGDGDSFYAKSPGYLLRKVAFNRATWTAGATLVYSTMPSTFDGIGVDVGANILGGVNFSDTPNDLQLYQLSGNANEPALFAQAFFGSVNVNSQDNAVTTLKGGQGFALDVNNGITAVSYGAPPAPATTITSVSYQAGTGTTLTWLTFNNHTYQVQYRDSLTAGNWADIGPATPATGATLSYLDGTATGAVRFYRVVGQ